MSGDWSSDVCSSDPEELSTGEVESRVCALTLLKVGEANVLESPVVPFSLENPVPEVCALFLCFFSLFAVSADMLIAERDSLFFCSKGFSTFVSLPPLPEEKGTSAAPDLQDDPDEQDISVCSAASVEDAEAADSDELPIILRKRGRSAGSKAAGKSKQGSAAEGSSSSSPPARVDEGVPPARDPVEPPPKRTRAAPDCFDPAALLTVLSS